MHLHIEDVETVHRPYDTVPHEDETPRKSISSDKITITKYGTARQEEIKRRKHPNDVHIGRIVVDEMPGEKELRPREDQEQPRDRQVTITRKEVKDVPKLQEESIPVGKLDLRDVEKDVIDSRKPKRTLVTPTERVYHSRTLVTDQSTVAETKINVIDERLRMDTRTSDTDVQKTGEYRANTDMIDGGPAVDDKTRKQEIVESTLGKISLTIDEEASRYKTLP